MSRISSGRLEFEGADAGRCFFCGQRVRLGSHWLGFTGDLCLCFWCASDGKVGIWLGDVARDMDDVARLLDRTAREAWLALVSAYERERRK
jgi:hypothetical protein